MPWLVYSGCFARLVANAREGKSQYSANVVCIKAMHALAFGRWLAKRGMALTDLSEVQIKQYQRRRRHRSIRAETRRRECCGVTQLLQFSRRNECVPYSPGSSPIMAAHPLTILAYWRVDK